MKRIFGLTLVFLLNSNFVWAEKQIVPTAPCSVSISLREPLLKEKLQFWGKILEIKEADVLPRGQEILFEPKTTHAGPKLKQVKIFIKQSYCRIDLKKDQYWSVVLDEKGSGAIFAIKFEGDGKIRKSNKFPHFEPEMNDCDGFDARLGFTSADLYVFAEPLKIEADEKESIRVITFKAKRVWSGPKVETFKVIQKIGTCDSPFYPGSNYDLILNVANEKYFYHDCCGVTGSVGSDYESSAAERNKKYLSGANKKTP